MYKIPFIINVSIRNRDEDECCCGNCALRQECENYTDDDGICEEYLDEDEVDDAAEQAA